MFEKVYECARQSFEINNLAIEKINNLVKEYSDEENIRNAIEYSKWEIFQNPSTFNGYSKELFDLINTYNFKIIEYGKRLDKPDMYEYDSVIEYYSVCNDKYKFIIRNLDDPDIEEGIFAIYNIINLITNEKIEFYLDFGCRNTFKQNLDDFLLLISLDSKSDFLNKKFSKYIVIPELLEKNGFKITENTIKYELSRISGFIKIADNIFVRIYFAINHTIKVVVTNNPKWDVNSSNGRSDIGYYVDYNSEDDIDVLVDNINAFVKHIIGMYGFLENNIYYRNDDINNFFRTFQRKNEYGNYLKCYNQRIINIEKVDAWDYRGIEKASYINIYDGLEIAEHYKFSIDSAKLYDSIINLSDIVFKYDKKIDQNKCILLIANYQFCQDNNYYETNDDYDEIDKLSTCYNKDFLVEKVEFAGTFTECLEKLKEYIYTLLNIYHIDITEYEN